MLPDKYRWLLRETAPRILVQALRRLGVREVPGGASNPIIIGWAKEIGDRTGMDYSADSTPWCGLFVAICAKRAGLELPAVAVRARSWANWGNRAWRAMLGDVLVFERPGGGHVGLYVGEDALCYHVLGGNQADAVTIARIEKSRCIAIRRTPWQIAQPASVRPVLLQGNGAISTNEA